MAARMLVFASIKPGEEREFEKAFAQVRQSVATVDGHISDELMCERDKPGSYVIVSEWKSRHAFETWLQAPAHEEMTEPVRPYFARQSDLRFYDVRVT